MQQYYYLQELQEEGKCHAASTTMRYIDVYPVCHICVAVTHIPDKLQVYIAK